MPVMMVHVTEVDSNRKEEEFYPEEDYDTEWDSDEPIEEVIDDEEDHIGNEIELARQIEY